METLKINLVLSQSISADLHGIIRIPRKNLSHVDTGNEIQEQVTSHCWTLYHIQSVHES